MFDRVFDYARGGSSTPQILWLTRCKVEGITGIGRARVRALQLPRLNYRRRPAIFAGRRVIPTYR
jgi:hypothetical protein